MKNKNISRKISVFHGRFAPEEGIVVGYGAIVDSYSLNVPMPKVLSLISSKKRQYKNDQWQVFTSRHLPEDTLYKQLVFSIKYEGINLLILKKLFEQLTVQSANKLFQIEPMGLYSRKLWFLYEWLLDVKLQIPNLKNGNYINLLDKKLQYGISNGKKSSRHRIINNFPGNKDFCPLIRRTEKLDEYIVSDFTQRNSNYLKGISKDILQRASAFLLLKDSKASFNIEGESPRNNRAVRWGHAIGQAGSNDLSSNELLRLQQILIEHDRFISMGFRKEGGFVGQHDRISGKPIPDHISARPQDLELLIDGLIYSTNLLLKSDINAVLAAATIAFGFVFIHPFEDGNGRIHRYLIHHILARKNFSQQGIIFPVSASILDYIDDYRRVLESYSQPLLDYIEWEETKNHNIKVKNDTIDFYRYYDATTQAEFLCDCVNDTINNIIPNEVKYLQSYDHFKRYLDDEFEMPDKTIALLVRFLEQNSCKLSIRAKEKEFSLLSDEEVKAIETKFKEIFISK